MPGKLHLFGEGPRTSHEQVPVHLVGSPDDSGESVLDFLIKHTIGVHFSECYAADDLMPPRSAPFFPY